jgi:beta-fructofuranosidase
VTTVRHETSAPPTAAWEPRFHITAERNWLNDPNGPAYFDGRYHVFFQENPESPFWGPPHWGHVSSADLVTWQRHPRILSPDPQGPDADGCWSGCVRLIDGIPTAYYTGVTGHDDGRVESICRATGSPDLLTWTKDPDNPLVPGAPSPDRTGYHRDPYLWRDERGWHLLLGSGVRGSDDEHGTVLVYHSADATRWTYGGLFYAAPQADAAAAQDDFGKHWECPQLLRFDDGWVLILSIQDPAAERPLSHVVYLVGDLDPDDYRLRVRSTGRLDFGDVFYAPAVTTDHGGSPLMWGWAQEALTEERQRQLRKAGALTLPRRLTLAGDRLESRPAGELAGLRQHRLSGPANAGPGDRIPLASTVPGQAEISARILGTAGTVKLALEHTDGDTTVDISVDLDQAILLTHTRQESGTRSYQAPLPEAAATELTAYLDGSLIEIHCGGTSITTRCYPRTQGSWSVTATITGSHAALRDISLWALEDAMTAA